MTRCPKCGQENRAEARFCEACGTPLARTPPPQEVRKTVTIVFSDLKGSTELGHTLDPEALRQLMSRYFEEMSAVLQRHGGTVEKYIGDAIMAVFGIPVVREDDALRALRAATEMQDRLAVLNQEAERVWGVRIATRTGVNSGEVIAGAAAQGHVFATGEAVNVAKRLEEVASSGEILVGEATARLAGDDVLLEPTGPRIAKHGVRIDALRLVEVAPGVPGRALRFDSPLVGRERQLGSLVSAFTNAVTDRTCHLFTVLGAAGVGKSRLVEEFVRGLGVDVRVLRGHCLPYGEGITYWPVAEVVREAVGGGGHGDDRHWVEAIAAQVEGDPKAELIADRVGQALGLGGASGGGESRVPLRRPGGQEETFWALRRFFESIAQRQPLVVVFDDVHWGETTFLDLVEHIADFSRDAPLQFVCIARPELLDERPGWGGGKLNATSILLEGLSESDCRQLITNLLDHASLPPDVETRIAAATGGNPFFTEELLAMLIDDELVTRRDGHWIALDDLSELPVPPTINALLTGHLERLPEDEQILVKRGSVEGTVFHRNAVCALSPDWPDADIGRALTALVRRDVIRPNRASFAGDEAFRFRHVLIRDAAYHSLPKGARADLHERFADWLEQAAGARLREFEEIAGYHLERAYRYRADLESINPEASALASRAVQRLESAGRRALARSDLPASISLLERSANLVASDDRERPMLLAELGAALIEAGKLAEADSTLAEADRLAKVTGDERAESYVQIQQQFLHLVQVAEGGTDEAARVVARAVPVFERYDDDRGLCRARRLEAWLHWNEARAGAAAEAWERAADHARRAGDEDERSDILNWVASSIFFGPMPVAEGIRRCEEIRREVAGNLGAEGWTLRSLAGLYAMDGRFERARELLATSRAMFEELGETLSSAVTHIDASIELLAGNRVAAEESLRACYRALEEMGDKAFLSTTAAYLAQVIFVQGRSDEAERFTELSEELAASGDIATQAMWRSVRAKVFAGQGRAEEAATLAREAVALAERTDFLNHRAEAWIDLAEILTHAGRADEGRSALSEGLALYELKGNVVAARNARTRFGEV